MPGSRYKTRKEMRWKRAEELVRNDDRRERAEEQMRNNGNDERWMQLRRGTSDPSPPLVQNLQYRPDLNKPRYNSLSLCSNMTNTYPCSQRPRGVNNPQRELEKRTEFGGVHPDYKMMSNTGHDYYRTITYQVVLGGRSTEGSGRTRNDAKHAAAKRMLKLLDVNVADDKKKKNNHQNVHDDKKKNNEQNVEVSQNMAMLESHGDDDHNQTVAVIQNMATLGINDDNGEDDDPMINVRPKRKPKVVQNVQVQQNIFGGAAQSVNVKQNISRWKR